MSNQGSTEQRITFEMATRDDVLGGMVPSDLRKLVLERDRAEATVTELRAQVAELELKLRHANYMDKHKAEMRANQAEVRAYAAEARCKQQAAELDEVADLLRDWLVIWTEDGGHTIPQVEQWLDQHPATDEPESQPTAGYWWCSGCQKGGPATSASSESERACNKCGNDVMLLAELPTADSLRDAAQSEGGRQDG